MIDTRFSVSIQIMMTIASHKDELVKSDLLAKVLDTNPTFIRKIVSRLVDADLVTSFRGKGGGLQLAKKPTDITLKDIYIASTEDKRLINTHTKPIKKSCKVSCCIDEVLEDVVTGMETATWLYLSKKSLNDLLKRI
jgi:Rrf2 family protein